LSITFSAYAHKKYTFFVIFLRKFQNA